MEKSFTDLFPQLLEMLEKGALYATDGIKELIRQIALAGVIRHSSFIVVFIMAYIFLGYCWKRGEKIGCQVDRSAVKIFILLFVGINTFLLLHSISWGVTAAFSPWLYGIKVLMSK